MMVGTIGKKGQLDNMIQTLLHLHSKIRDLLCLTSFEKMFDVKFYLLFFKSSF